jgi:ABC-type polysaccharide/polyol phosphate transport system ATPase subunit
MLLVSHEPRTIAAFCGRALLLEAGHIMMEGPAADVADAYLAMLAQPPLADPPRHAAAL